MEVVLLERVQNLGQMGDVVTVKDGFARNFLLPQEKALRATEANLARFENEKVELEARNLENKKEAEAVRAVLDGHSSVILRQASEMDQLYGSVSNRDVAEKLNEEGFHVERRQVRIDEPIKTLGLHELKIDLHPEVTATVSINVARSAEEAEQRARGAEAEGEDSATEAFFETEELARQADAELADEDDTDDEITVAPEKESEAESDKENSDSDARATDSEKTD